MAEEVNKTYDVLGLGNALVDILVEVDDTVLTDLGLTKGQFNGIDETKSEKILDKIKYTHATISPGGSAGNAIAMIALLGGKTAFCGKIGQDEYGALYEEESRKMGVVPLLSRNKSPTGHCVVLITPDAERTFAVNLGASVEMENDDVSEEEVKKSRILHVDGYQLEQAREVCLYALGLARKNNVKISVDISDPGVVGRNKDLFIRIVKDFADIVFANEEEARVMCEKDPEIAVSVLGEWCHTAIVKCGKNGSLVSVGGAVTMIPVVDALRIIDTTGAGDAYAAGFLYGLTHKKSIEASGKLASQLGSKIVEKVGARLTKEELSAALLV